MEISGRLHLRFRTYAPGSQNLGPNSGFSIFSRLGCRICSILHSQLENHGAYSSENFRSIAFLVPDLWSKVSKFSSQTVFLIFSKQAKPVKKVSKPLSTPTRLSVSKQANKQVSQQASKHLSNQASK